MKEYDQDEFEAEVIKKLGWTTEQYRSYLREQMKTILEKKFDEGDLEFFVKKIKENVK